MRQAAKTTLFAAGNEASIRKSAEGDFSNQLGESRQGAERLLGAERFARHGDPSNLIQFMLA
jgi:hypothetical protein